MFAEKKTLIDFSLLTADAEEEGGDEQPTFDRSDRAIPAKNAATQTNYAQKADSSYTAAQRAQMDTSLAISNWEVVLAPSSQNPYNVTHSYTKQVETRGVFQAPSGDGNASVLGVRIHFPVEPFNSWALIKPPFDIPGYEYAAEGEELAGTIDDPLYQPRPTRFEGGYGVLKNVGVLKSVQAQVYGLRFPHALHVILIDDRGVEKKIFMGYLNFEGWGKLIWNNPAYVSEVRNRALRLYPLYPDYVPLYKFGGFQISRSADNVGGDFIAYFKDVQVIYDQASIVADPGNAEDPNAPDINSEEWWNITADREANREKNQYKDLGRKQVERYFEVQRKAIESFSAEDAVVAPDQE